VKLKKENKIERRKEQTGETDGKYEAEVLNDAHLI